MQNTRRYLMDGHHWRIRGVAGFSRFFQALQRLAPPASFLALAAGAWPNTVRLVLSECATDPLVRPALVSEFDQALFVPISELEMVRLAGLADEHAEPEIAIHLAAFRADGPWLEWFDAPDDPIALSSTMPPEAVAQFALEIGGTHDDVSGSSASSWAPTSP
jgi:hypothetical protein